MEVAAQPSLPSFSPLLPRCRKVVGFDSPSSLRFCNYKGTYIGCSLQRQLNLKNSCDSVRRNFLCYQRKHDIVSSSGIMGLDRSFYSSRSYERNKSARYVVARSVLAGTGNPDASYPSPGVKLGSKLRGVVFYVVTSIAAIFLIIPMLLAHPFVLLLDRYRRKFQHYVAEYWALLAVTPFVKVEFEGLENLPPSDTPAVYVSNHQSFFDIYTLLTLGRSFKFISKTSIFLYPVIGWAMLMMGVIPLKRMDSKSQLECLKRCMDLIKKGASVFFFPEGTRSKDGKLGAFKKGAFSVAVKTGVPVVPMTLIGTGKIMPVGMESILNPGSVRVVVHKPISGSDAQELCDEARNRISDALARQS